MNLISYSQEQLQGSNPNLAQIFLMGSRTSVVTFVWIRYPKMTVLASDWLTHFQHFLVNSCRDLLKTWHTFSLPGSDQVLWLLCGSKIQDYLPGLWFADTFSTSSQER